MAYLHPEGIANMPRKSPYKISLSATEKAELEQRARKYTLAYFLVQRAKIILLAAKGWSNYEIAQRLDTRREVVSFWRKRFFEERLAGLDDRDRSGRPRVFPPRSDHASQSPGL
jgi:DNA-binding NarL/FixJ family response regulator